MDKHSMREDSYARFHQMLHDRGYDSYEHYLASDAWRQFNEWYRRTPLPQGCLVCGNKEFQLHHWTYDNIGQDNPCDVIPLCAPHHLEIHRWLDAHGGKLWQVPVHLERCFNMDRGRADWLFRKFINLRKKMCRVSKTRAIVRTPLNGPSSAHLKPKPSKPMILHPVRCGWCNGLIRTQPKPFKSTPEACIACQNIDIAVSGLNEGAVVESIPCKDQSHSTPWGERRKERFRVK